MAATPNLLRILGGGAPERWRMEGGTAEARFATKGYKHPDLKEGNADITGRVTMRSPRRQVIPLRINMPSRKQMDSALMSVVAPL